MGIRAAGTLTKADEETKARAKEIAAARRAQRFAAAEVGVLGKLLPSGECLVVSTT
jgi:hypothetical protein